MTDKEVMQQALDALRGADAIDTDMQDAIYTLYEALEQPEQERQIAEALRRYGLSLVKTATGYDVMQLGPATAHGIKEKP